MSLVQVGSGKVREIYDAGEGLLLMVATDRISAYDVILDQVIPDKGKVLNGLSLFWFAELDSIVPNHLITDDPGRFPAAASSMEDLAGRAMLVRRAEMLPVEFIVRGYLYGSGYTEYEKFGSASGIPLPDGLKMASRLPEAVVTPTTKADEGHDAAITPEEAAKLCGEGAYNDAAEAALAIYRHAHNLALERGVVIADTKFEFGIIDGEVVLADEVLTPDSSRFWPAADYEPGRPQASFDKQFVRDWLDDSKWDRTPPPPPLPPDVVEATRGKYIEAYDLVTGKSFSDYIDSYV